MGSADKLVKIEERETETGFEQLYRISEIAKMLHVSRGSVYNLLRGERIIDLGNKNKRGCKLVPASTLHAIIDRKIKVFR
jgi:hypothetical protein